METKLVTTIIADISDSTPFYEAMGDDQAQELIQLELGRLRDVLLGYGGVPVGQKGDDVLCYFYDPEAAIQSVLEMIQKPPGTLLSVHAGVHQGPVVVGDNGIFGETVNLTARLAAAANPGEACVSDSVAKDLSTETKMLLTTIGSLRLKGVSEPVKAYSVVASNGGLNTVMHVPTQTAGSYSEGHHSENFALILYYDDRMWRCREGGELKIGRSGQCDVILPQPWVSRLHAVLSMKAGKLMLADRSSSGTYVQVENAREVQLKRESVMLADSGLISPALPILHTDARPLEFEVVRR
ncbi:adenylate/guanylate cyclase domain-containing protein [Ruegeria halocynthiae]|uniref:adenylate/guanylate cyclase domain-containing protein n=1 Tax=Ruegeria halocynthiae TaxID=985054 RepID=UPI0009431D35|nr:adenylate/guanylate cyclase domain-containing protein [Ruegeria halocynthiae]